MKQVLFILLVFISFEGFSQTQTVKLNRIGLEVMKTDLGQMTYVEAKKACEKLGGDWRLPTVEEFDQIYKYKDRVGGFVKVEKSYYWTLNGPKDKPLAFTFYSEAEIWTKEIPSSIDFYKYGYTFHVRAVRDLE